MIRAVAIAMVFPLSAVAQEYITTQGRLSDDNFYRLVACAAEPAEPCKKDIVRWRSGKAKRLTVSLFRTDDGFPKRSAHQIADSLDAAILELNASGANLQLNRIENGKRADIRLFLKDIDEGGTISGTRIQGLDGNKIEVAHVYVWWNDRKRISSSVIVFSNDVRSRDTRSIVLEEIVQSLGFLTDIKNRYYENRSIFSEDGNNVRTLRDQDIMVLRRHYP